MKYYAIGDADTVLGFRYVGVRGEEVNNADEARQALARAQADPSIGVVILVDSVAESIRADVDKLRVATRRPLVVEIPGRAGPVACRRSLLDLIREAVGVRV